jgi:hypothetical protein
MAIDPKNARAALEREFKDLTPSAFRERLDRSIPTWATPTKKAKTTKKARVKAPPRPSALEPKPSAKKK